ncbi:MAG: arylsulfatase [Verrucomicrobiae bacterium]|nr:arylsulfatase [Verrucomicrobiae bacterium]
MLLFLVAALLWPLTTKAAALPNIVFVLFDDLGYGQPPCYAPETRFKLPNLDRLAAEGMRFTDAHSASAVCTPTRYGVMTGRYPWRIGQFGVLTTYSPPIIPTTRTTVASLLKQQGYATACIGKWHLGMNWVDGKPGSESEVPIGARMTDGPLALGFDTFYGFTHARNIGTIIEQDAVVAHVQPDENQPLMIKKAVEWIGQRAQEKDRPFFLYYPMCPPHTPVAPSAEFIGKSGAEDIVKHDPKYGDWILQGDDMLGQILDALEQGGVADNTLVIATADNGAEGRPYPPLRDAKRSIHEGGHRVPFIARWPGKVEAGSVNAHTVCLNDLIATAAELTGTTLPPGAGEDSVSLLPELLGKAGEGARDFTVHQSMAGDLAIRQGPWKLIFKVDGSRELYRLDNDLGETKDLASSQPDIVDRLETKLREQINTGRSTPGDAQANEFTPSLDGKSAKKKKGGKKAK